jgi:hypothetical protein
MKSGPDGQMTLDLQRVSSSNNDTYYGDQNTLLYFWIIPSVLPVTDAQKELRYLDKTSLFGNSIVVAKKFEAVNISMLGKIGFSSKYKLPRSSTVLN